MPCRSVGSGPGIYPLHHDPGCRLARIPQAPWGLPTKSPKTHPSPLLPNALMVPRSVGGGDEARMGCCRSHTIQVTPVRKKHQQRESKLTPLQGPEDGQKSQGGLGLSKLPALLLTYHLP